ncbi:hypothetical protein JVU11DRAFT_2470 [Chiua virens]|nr:hypothetical protein JVU11DRAFT_2470 [Chiua virens]
MSFVTRIKSIIPNRLSFCQSSKATDVNKFGIAEHITTGATPPSTINVVLFGESGVGKSSVVNLIARKEVAEVSSDVRGCTMQSTKHDIEFDGMKFAIFETIGLEQPRMEVNGYLKAIENVYEFIINLSHAGGVHLLLFCMRGGKISATTKSNYQLFSETLRVTGVPIAVVFTGLEQEVEMEDWWRRNKTHIENYGIKSDGHACITTIQEETHKYAESQKTIRKLLKTCALRNTARSVDALSWFARCAKDMDCFIEGGMSPKRKKVLEVLMKHCKLDSETAKKIADMMENGDSAQPGLSLPAASGRIQDPRGRTLAHMPPVLLSPALESERVSDQRRKSPSRRAQAKLSLPLASGSVSG